MKYFWWALGGVAVVGAGVFLYNRRSSGSGGNTLPASAANEPAGGSGGGAAATAQETAFGRISAMEARVRTIAGAHPELAELLLDRLRPLADAASSGSWTAAHEAELQAIDADIAILAGRAV